MDVIERNGPDFRTRIRRHRVAVFARTASLIVLAVAAVLGLYHYLIWHTYTEYEVLEEDERQDTAATHFVAYADGMLKYSNDGAFYTDLDGSLIWNQTYEMDNPRVDIRGASVAVADVGGMNVYLLDSKGDRGQIETTMPVYAFSVAEEGNVALLLSGEDEFFLRIYDRDGKEVAAGELFIRNSGYPVSLSLSPDAKKLAILFIQPGVSGVTSTVQFYNFGAVGQNEQDRIVGSYSYGDLMVPRVRFLDDETLVAFGDNAVLLFSGSQKPEESARLDLTEEVKSVFYDDEHFGLVFNNGDAENTRRMEVYDKRGRLTMSRDFEMDYDEIGFLSDGEVCIRSDWEVALVSKRGVERFRHSFDTALLCVVPERFHMYYTFIFDGMIQRIRLQ